MKSKRNILQTLIFLAVVLIVVCAYMAVGQAENSVSVTGETQDLIVSIPFTSIELDLRNAGLVIASIFIGLLDGFNPCAMWVLVYLITLVASISDKKKMWFIVGTFLFSSGFLYFIILALWLNGWDLLKYFGLASWMLYLVGGFALFTGIISIKDFIEKGGHMTCEVGDLGSRKKTMMRIKDIVHSPITIASVFATIILAIAINSIEFVCSAGLPAMYTQILSVADVHILIKYLNIGIYTLAFMADDLIIFSLALFAINTALMQKYSGLSKLLGGIVMIAIGILLLFFPGALV